MKIGPRKSFNIVGNDKTIWDGLSKGPPRKLKWIEHDDAIKAVKAALKKK